LILKIQRHYPEMPLPARGHASDAGLDLTAMAVEELRPGVFSCDSGVSVEAEPGYYCEVVSRSSIVRGDFLLANGVGVIDPDYRGRIRVVLRYLGEAGDGGRQAAQALLGTRIAQLLVRRLEQVTVEAADALERTPRGGGGFGSTGK
jgi:dUTP pyrophosphatase